jgi:uncharacterized membrane protein
MLETIAIILLVLWALGTGHWALGTGHWALGMVTAYTMGGFIHILLVIAVVVVLIRVIRGNSPL